VDKNNEEELDPVTECLGNELSNVAVSVSKNQMHQAEAQGLQVEFVTEEKCDNLDKTNALDDVFNVNEYHGSIEHQYEMLDEDVSDDDDLL